MVVIVWLAIGHLIAHYLELVMERGQGRHGSDTRWQVVPGTGSSHWRKCLVAKCGPASAS